MKRFLFFILCLNVFTALAGTTLSNNKIFRVAPVFTPELRDQNPNIPVCQFARKDYDSPGFGIAYREGFYIKGTFGCVYYCGCNGTPYYVTHVFTEEYFDSEIWSSQTGGPKRAKWFICPHSVDNNSWKPMRDELERIIGYQVDEDRSFFEPRQSTMKEINQWANAACNRLK